MKKFTFLILLTVCTSVISFAQLRKIPAAVTENFKQKYPQASQVEWKASLTSYTANFDKDGERYHAKFNNKGEWVSTEHEITEDKLPATVKDGLAKSKYADWETGKVTHIELPGNQVQYRVEVIKSDIQKKNLLFSSDGRLLKDNITL